MWRPYIYSKEVKIRRYRCLCTSGGKCFVEASYLINFNTVVIVYNRNPRYFCDTDNSPNKTMKTDETKCRILGRR